MTVVADPKRFGRCGYGRSDRETIRNARVVGTTDRVTGIGKLEAQKRSVRHIVFGRREAGADIQWRSRNPNLQRAFHIRMNDARLS